MDITDYRREVACIQKRRSVELGSHEDVPTLQKGQTGPLEHPRLGLVGWIAYWSLGNCALAVKMCEPRGSNTEDDMLEDQFEKWYVQIKDERFWSWLEETDNATHFKSKENLLFWSERPASTKNLSRWCG